MKKKIGIWVVIILIGVLLIGMLFFAIRTHLEKQKSETGQNEIKNTARSEDIVYTPLEQLPQEYSFVQALKDGCFIITYREVYNMEMLENFIENTGINSKNRISDTLRIVQYTVEGDMILTDVSYRKEENKYIVTKDNTRDAFSGKEDRVIRSNDDFPGQFYGITKIEEEEYIKIELALYAIIDYVDENVKPYENYEIGSYLKTANVNATGPSFVATVLSVNENHILVKTDDTQMNLSSDQYMFGIPEGSNIKLEVGNRIRVTYTGDVRETYPAQIDVIKIEVVEE